MRSSIGIRSSNALNTHSQLGGPVSVACIVRPNNNVSKQAKFNINDQIQNFEKLLESKSMITSSLNGLHYQTYPNRDIYYGQHDNGIPHGQGVYIFSSQNDKQPYYFYAGRFQNGQLNGFGKLCQIINSKEAAYIYQGFWKMGKRQGEGRQYYPNGSYYFGQWSNDLYEGQGELFMAGSHLKGLWQKGKMNGQGIMTTQSGPFKTVIQGIWQNDNINRGIIRYYSSKQTNLLGQYEGGISKFLREGQGVFKQGNTIIEGMFANDQLVSSIGSIRNMTEKGEYKISGNLVNPNLSRLNSEISYLNKDRYEGFVDINNNTILRTQGRYTFANGETHQGYFQDNPQGVLRLR